MKTSFKLAFKVLARRKIEMEVEFTFDCLLTRQDYTLTIATQYREGFSQDWLDDVISFSVVDARDVAGLANLKTHVECRRIKE